MAIAREAGPVTGREELREVGLDREDLLQLYRHMLLTRGLEERGHILYRQGKIPGSFYTGRGNEASSAAAASARARDAGGTPPPAATWASPSPAASSRGGSSPTTWAARRGRRRAGTATSTWPTSTSAS